MRRLAGRRAVAELVAGVAVVRRPARSLGLAWPLSNRATFLTVLILTLLALGFVALKVRRLNLGYEIAQNRRSLTALEEAQRKTLAEVAALKRPRRIERLAREKRGLLYPSPSQLIVLKDGR